MRICRYPDRTYYINGTEVSSVIDANGSGSHGGPKGHGTMWNTHCRAHDSSHITAVVSTREPKVQM